MAKQFDRNDFDAYFRHITHELDDPIFWIGLTTRDNYYVEGGNTAFTISPEGVLSTKHLNPREVSTEFGRTEIFFISAWLDYVSKWFGNRKKAAWRASE